jgi:glycosyltransferase involved in cell wall biosynthesis
MPPELERFGSRARHIPPVANYAEFLPFLRSLGWWVGLAPLEDNIFNRCKADTKWVEYSLAGTAVVASDLPVYHRACDGGAGKLASGAEQWSTAIKESVGNPAGRTRMVEAAQNKLRRLYSHSRLREQVIKVFEEASYISAKTIR